MSSDRQTMDPAEQVARLYERTEAEAAKASERLVGSGGFASLLGQMAENVAALTRIGGDTIVARGRPTSLSRALTSGLPLARCCVPPMPTSCPSSAGASSPAS